jgi:hypothetical protein
MVIEGVLVRGKNKKPNCDEKGKKKSVLWGLGRENAKTKFLWPKQKAKGKGRRRVVVPM